MRRITCERSSGSWAAHTNTTPWKLAPLAARPALRSARRRRWPSRPIGLPLGSRASRASRLVRFMPMRYSAVSGTRAYAAQRRLGHSCLCSTAPSRALGPMRYSAVSGVSCLFGTAPSRALGHSGVSCLCSIAPYSYPGTASLPHRPSPVSTASSCWVRSLTRRAQG